MFFLFFPRLHVVAQSDLERPNIGGKGTLDAFPRKAKPMVCLDVFFGWFKGFLVVLLGYGRVSLWISWGVDVFSTDLCCTRRPTRSLWFSSGFLFQTKKV